MNSIFFFLAKIKIIHLRHMANVQCGKGLSFSNSHVVSLSNFTCSKSESKPLDSLCLLLAFRIKRSR